MCVQVAYVGKKIAAPILLKMLKEIEGLWAGFYSGIATIANGRIYHDKVIGDLSTLCKSSEVEKFPGTVGIAHSRTPGKGDREWGHPFLDCSGNLVFCEQGSPGIFRKEYGPSTARIAAELIEEGHHFRSATRAKLVTEAATLGPSGESIHTSEVVCHKVESNLKKSDDMLKAMSDVFNEIKVEIAMLAIEVSHPQQVFMTTVNQPLVIGWDETGAYVATSTLAFPNSVTRSFRLPAGCAAVISPTNLKIVNLPEWRDIIKNPFISAEVEKAIISFLRKNPRKSLPEICNQCVKTLYPEGVLTLCAETIYEIIEKLLKRRKVICLVEHVLGAEEGLTAPKMVFECNFSL